MVLRDQLHHDTVKEKLVDDRTFKTNQKWVTPTPTVTKDGPSKWSLFGVLFILAPFGMLSGKSEYPTVWVCTYTKGIDDTTGVRGKKNLESEAGMTSWITCSLYMSLQRTQSIQPFLGNRPRKHVNSAINTLLTQACPRPDSNQFTPRGTSSCRSVMSSAQNFEPQYIRQGKSSRPRHRVPIILSHSVPVNPPSVIRSGWYKCDKTTIRHEDHMV